MYIRYCVLLIDTIYNKHITKKLMKLEPRSKPTGHQSKQQL